MASEGYFYPSGSVYSSGTVKILPITAEHEELLCNTNLARRGLLETEFLNSVVDGGINPDELLHCDKLSILLNLRIANYGAMSKMRIGCEGCDAEYEQDASFGFSSIPFDFSKYERGVNVFYYTFPKCRKAVSFKLPSCSEYDVYIKYGWLALAKLVTLSIEGVEHISDFYEYELSATDSAAFRKYFENNTPGYVNNVIFSCPSCNRVKKSKIDINTSIYGVRPERKMNIHSEIFDLCYHSNGAFTQDCVYKMPTALRSFYIKKLVEVKKQEADANKAASEGKSESGKIAKPPSVKR